jgi:membrane protein DedA with SNARE-associated domain
LTEQLVGHLGYIGIALILILGGLGLPIPEEAPIILAAVLSRNGKMSPPLAISTCLLGVLCGDFVVFLLGYFHGEKVLSLPVTRRLLTRAREAQIKGYFHRHGFKILVLGRFAPGFRTAAYLTAGILKLPALKLLLTDLVAASLSTCLMFGLGYIFAYQIQSGFREVQQWLTVILVLSLAIWSIYRYYTARKRAGLPVGPAVVLGDDLPLPSDELKAEADPDRSEGETHSPHESSPPPGMVSPPPHPPTPSPLPATPGTQTHSHSQDTEVISSSAARGSACGPDPIEMGPPPSQPTLESPR